MAKFVFVGVILAIVSGGSALLQDGDIAAAASKGDWDGVQEILKKYINSRIPIMAPLTQPLQPAAAAEFLNTLPAAAGSPGSGGRYYAQSEYSYEKKSNINGKEEEDKGGLGMINDNGKVTYYTPKPPGLAPLGFGNQNAPSGNISPYGG